MRVKRILLTIIILLSLVLSVQANGKVFNQSVDFSMIIPSQRALIYFDGQRQTLVLQSSFEAEKTVTTTETLGWVVPCPSLPEVASFSAASGDDLFGRLSKESETQVVYVWEALSVGIFLFLVLVFISTAPVYLLMRDEKRKSKILLRRIIIADIVAMILFTFFMGFFGSAAQGQMDAATSVVILDEQQAGAYDVKTIRADKSEDVVEWLNEHGFDYGDEDVASFDNYIDNDWCFVVAVVRPDEVSDMHFGRMDPLVFRFPSSQAVYPLALTATIGRETLVDLYVLSDKKMKTDQRLSLRYAGKLPDHFYYNNLDLPDVMKDYFKPWEREMPFLTEFAGNLTPEQMQEDLYLEFAENNRSYRETIYIWK